MIGSLLIGFVSGDQVTIEELDIICQIPHHVVVSAHHGWNIDEVGAAEITGWSLGIDFLRVRDGIKPTKQQIVLILSNPFLACSRE